MDIRITPSPLTGQVAAVSSKSSAIRLLICAALSDRETILTMSDICEDIEAAVRCLIALGAGIKRTQKGFVVQPIPLGEVQEPIHGVLEPLLDCGESASTLRFLLPVAAAIYGKAIFTGKGRLPQRPVYSLLKTLEDNGASFSSHHLPLIIEGRLQSGNFQLPGDISSQFVSGLLLALPLLKNEGSILLTSPLESSSYVDMTVSCMKQFSINAVCSEHRFSLSHQTASKQTYRSPGTVSIEGDWTNAAVFMAAGVLGGNISINGLNTASVQGDKHIMSLLALFGVSPKTSSSPGEASSISVGQSRLVASDIDLHEIPDLLPILAVLASAAEGTSRFYGGHRLRFKESNRLETTARLINSMGGEAVETDQGLIVTGKTLTGGIVDSCGDHRIAMAAAIAAAYAKNPTVILKAESVNKSYPGFFDDFIKLGGKADVL